MAKVNCSSLKYLTKLQKGDRDNNESWPQCFLNSSEGLRLYKDRNYMLATTLTINDESGSLITSSQYNDSESEKADDRCEEEGNQCAHFLDGKKLELCKWKITSAQSSTS